MSHRAWTGWSGWGRAACMAGVACAAIACSDSKDEPALAAPVDAGPPRSETAPDAAPPSSPASDPASDAGSGETVDLEPGPMSCNPGQTRACQQDFLCSGLATCGPDGLTYGPCECDTSLLSGAPIVGASCQDDADCAGGATCLRADGGELQGGGPAGGYCTFTCAAPEDCEALDPQSTCADVGGGSLYCLRTCLSKEPAPGEAKCLNRTDVACVSVVAAGLEPFSSERQQGFCFPQCGSDEDCPAGRQCHRQGGICTDFAAPGSPVGAACSVDTDCDGRACEDRVDGVGTCTASCVLGVLSGCGYSRAAEPRDAACITPVVAAGRFSEGPGDLGFCLELCDADADCQRSSDGFACRPLNEELATFLGRAGACARN